MVAGEDDRLVLVLHFFHCLEFGAFFCSSFAHASSDTFLDDEYGDKEDDDEDQCKCDDGAESVHDCSSDLLEALGRSELGRILRAIVEHRFSRSIGDAGCFAFAALVFTRPAHADANSLGDDEDKYEETDCPNDEQAEECGQCGVLPVVGLDGPVTELLSPGVLPR